MKDAEPLDSLALDVEIGSSEGVSRDHSARIRVQYLSDQSALLARQTQFADTKATAVLALSGLVGARAAAGFDVARLAPAEIAVILLTALSLGLCFVVLIPRYPPRVEQAAVLRAERYSWVALSAPGYTAEAYARFARSAEIGQFIASMATANVAMARVLATKFRYLRAAFLVALLDVAVAAAHALGLFAAGQSGP